MRNIVLTNQYGEVSVNSVVDGSDTKSFFVEQTLTLTFDHSVGAKSVLAKKVGNQVFLTIPAAAITNGAGTACASSAMAAAYRPAAAVTLPCLVIDNGTTRKIGQVVIGTDGVITFSVLGTGFTTSQAAGWDRVGVTYAQS